jgi:IMP dehydrogenase
MASRVDASDGWTADQLFKGSTGPISFDDVVILPGAASVQESAINCAAKLTKGSPVLNVPIVGGPSEAVVGPDMAIALALAGGIGIIHRNQSVEAQVDMVRKVKQYHSGFILNPQTLGPNKTVADIDRIKAEFGYGAIPITENGKMGGKLIGLVTTRDVEDLVDRSTNVQKVMTKVADLIVAQAPVRFRDFRSPTQTMQAGYAGATNKGKSDDVEEIMFTNKIGKLPVVNEDMELVALICRGDTKRVREYPLASRDATRQLLCAAAVATNDQEDWPRCQALVEAGVDIICLDTDDGVTDVAVDFVRRIKQDSANGGSVEVLAGRVSSIQQAKMLLQAGVDGLRIGSFACGGAADASTLYAIAKLAHTNHGVPCCSEGARDATQMFKALCLGANSVTMTDILSSCAEIPGDHHYRDGVRVKLLPTDGNIRNNHRGTGLGVSGIAPGKRAPSSTTVDRGLARTLLPYLAGQVTKGLQSITRASISDAHAALLSGDLRMERQLTQPRRPDTSEQQPRTVRLASSALHNRW